MDKVSTFILRLDPTFANRVIAVIRRIENGDLDVLDVTPLKGFPRTYRCRIRSVRIIFVKDSGGNMVIDVDFRGNVYKH